MGENEKANAMQKAMRQLEMFMEEVNALRTKHGIEYVTISGIMIAQVGLETEPILIAPSICRQFGMPPFRQSPVPKSALEFPPMTDD